MRWLKPPALPLWVMKKLAAVVTVIVRGCLREASVAAGVENVRRVNGGEVLSTHIIARPHENLEYVLPIRYTEDVQQFRRVPMRFAPTGP